MYGVNTEIYLWCVVVRVSIAIGDMWPAASRRPNLAPADTMAVRLPLLVLLATGVVSASIQKTVLSIVLTYDDASGEDNGPSGGACDATCWATETFGTSTTGSVHAIFHDGSYGAVSLVETGSERVVVSMGKALSSLGAMCTSTCMGSSTVPCPYEAEGAAALSASGKTASSFDLVEFWLPKDFDSHGCNWVGIARPCVGMLGHEPDSSDGCKTYLRVNRASTRAHEFGHNWGFGHASANGQAYGNPTSTMSAQDAKSFDAVARLQAGWLDEAALLRPPSGFASTITLRALCHPPSSAHGEYTAVVSRCVSCRTAGLDADSWDASSSVLRETVGGSIVLSYRGEVGQDATLYDPERGRVHVQLLKADIVPNLGGGSDLYAALRAGESYFSPWAGLAVHVCDIPSVDSARLALVHARLQSTAIATAIALCDGPSSPPSPPPPPPNACGCEHVTFASSSTAQATLFGPLWTRTSDAELTYEIAGSGSFLYRAGDVWYVSPTAGELSSTVVQAKSSASTSAACPTDAPSAGWQLREASQWVSATVDISCTCRCAHLSVSSAMATQHLGIATYHLEAGVVHNGRPRYASSSGRYIFYDGSRWRGGVDHSVTSGGELQASAPSADHCPYGGVEWQLREAEGGEGGGGGGWGQLGAVDVGCTCPCDVLSVTSDRHSLGKEGGVLYTRQPALKGEGGRPVYMDHAGRFLSFRAANAQWYVHSYYADDAFGSSFSSSGPSALLHHCPTDLDDSDWQGDGSASVRCACPCVNVRLGVAEGGEPAAASTSLYGDIYSEVQGGADSVNAGRPVYRSAAGRYLYYHGPSLRWLAGPASTSDADAAVRSSLTSAHCPLVGVAGWEVLGDDGMWTAGAIDGGVSAPTYAMCAGYQSAPPPVAPPSPPYESMCECSTYALSSSYAGTNKCFVNTEYALRLGRRSRLSACIHAHTRASIHACMQVCMQVQAQAQVRVAARLPHVLTYSLARPLTYSLTR